MAEQKLLHVVLFHTSATFHVPEGPRIMCGSAANVK
jgi:hypothetical protein